MAPLSPRARKRIELANTRFEITALDERERSLELTARDIAGGALLRCLPGVGAEDLVDAHVAALAMRGVRPRPEVIAKARAHLRRLLGKEGRR